VRNPLCVVKHARSCMRVSVYAYHAVYVAGRDSRAALGLRFSARVRACCHRINVADIAGNIAAVSRCSCGRARLQNISIRNGCRSRTPRCAGVPFLPNAVRSLFALSRSLVRLVFELTSADAQNCRRNRNRILTINALSFLFPAQDTMIQLTQHVVLVVPSLLLLLLRALSFALTH